MQWFASADTTAEVSEDSVIAPNESRLAHVDWLRGLACVVMFQGHCYDAWLSEEARQGAFFEHSQLLSTIAAPIFLFLAGMSAALRAEAMRARGASTAAIGRQTVVRGLQIFGLALLFRAQEFVFGWPGAPWSDLLRVDVLNIIGVSLAALGLALWADWKRCALLFGGVAAAVALLTPPLWTTQRPAWLPWYLESYVNGVHVYDEPQAWLFPLFPWAAFTFAGATIGGLLASSKPFSQRRSVLAGFGGTLLFIAAVWLNAQPWQLYAVYDFWHTSPNFFLMRVGIVMGLLFLAFEWCRTSLFRPTWSPLVVMGRTSLLMYWLHIMLVYGRFSILPKNEQEIGTATAGLAGITLMMLTIAVARARVRFRGLRWRTQAPSATHAPAVAPEI
jgi:uncharacterized membrane protein